MNFDNTVSDVHIYNITTNRGASSNNDGEFKLQVKVNDTLQISHLEFRTRRIIITEEQLKHQYLIINIDTMTNYLNTVELKNHNLTGDLAFDNKNIPEDTIPKVNFNLYKFKELAKMDSDKDSEVNKEEPFQVDANPIKMTGVGSSISIPMKDKESIMKRELRYKRSIPTKIIASLGEDYFIEKLKIPEDKIYHFITYCEYRNIFNLYKENRIIELLNILTEESIIYNKIK